MLWPAPFLLITKCFAYKTACVGVDTWPSTPFIVYQCKFWFLCCGLPTWFLLLFIFFSIAVCAQLYWVFPPFISGNVYTKYNQDLIFELSTQVYRRLFFWRQFLFFTAYTTQIHHTIVVKCLKMFHIHSLHLCTNIKNNIWSENHRKSASQELSKTLTCLNRLQSLLSRYTVCRWKKTWLWSTELSALATTKQLAEALEG